MFIYHRNIFVLYIIHQNSPETKSLCCIIPWFLRNRSHCRRVPRYRRYAPSYRRHQLSCRRPLFLSISPTVVSRRIFRRLLYKNEERYETVVLVQGVPYPCVSLLQILERLVDAINRKQAKSSRSERPQLCHLGDGSFARLPTVSLIFHLLRCCSMSAFCRSVTLTHHSSPTFLVWISSLKSCIFSYINVVVQPDYQCLI